MSFRVLASRLARRPLFEASVKVPATVEVSKVADQLVFAGPLGTSRLGLSSIDSLGDAALKLVPEQREIAVCTQNKAFFGTLQVGIYPAHPFPVQLFSPCIFAQKPSRTFLVCNLTAGFCVLSLTPCHCFTPLLMVAAEPAEEQDRGRDKGRPGVPAHFRHWLSCNDRGPDDHLQAGLQSRHCL